MKYVVWLALSAPFAACAGSGGPSPGDSSSSEGDAGTDANAPDVSFESCTEDNSKVLLRYPPVDVIWVVDGSPSEANRRDIGEGIVALANRLGISDRGGAALDYRITLIAAGTSERPSISVSAPDASRYRFVGTAVADPLVTLRDAYSAYREFLRADSEVHVFAVSSTDSALTAAQFETEFQRLLGRNFRFHAICSEDCSAPPAFGAVCMSSGPAHACGQDTPSRIAGARPGGAYLALRSRLDENMNTGSWFSFCEADWLGQMRLFTSQPRYPIRLRCNYGVPRMNESGRAVDPLTSNVIAVDEIGVSGSLRFPRVQGASSCGAGDGWYFSSDRYDEIVLCPASCSAAGSREIRIAFGCQTEIR